MRERVALKRIEGIDLVRTLAVICVICGHFFSVNTPYNQTPFDSPALYFQGYLKSVFCNVGVFLFSYSSQDICVAIRHCRLFIIRDLDGS